MAAQIDRPTTDTPTMRREKPRLGPPRVVVRGSWGRALPAPKPGEKEESIFTSWLMGLLGRPHPRVVEEEKTAQEAARR
jgi:hypothetical protein